MDSEEAHDMELLEDAREKRWGRKPPIEGSYTCPTREIRASLGSKEVLDGRRMLSMTKVCFHDMLWCFTEDNNTGG